MGDARASLGGAGEGRVVSMKGVQLCARFSIATNRLNYCGPADAEPALYRTIVEGADLEASAKALRKFEALEPYLQAIAEKHGLDLFDHDVVEAYWIGNDLLEAFTREDFRKILDTLQGRGLSRPIAARLAAHLPEGPIPHHMFHVSFVGVGAVTGKVATTLENMEMCRPSWGRVVRVDGNTAVVEKPSLTLDTGRMSLGNVREAAYDFDLKFLPGLKAGDWVGLHWGWPTVILEPGQLEKMRAYTDRSLVAANEALASLRLL